MRLAVRDVGRGEDESKPLAQAYPPEHVVRKVRPAARGHAAGDAPREQHVDERHGARHRLEPRVEQAGEDLVGLFGESLDRVRQSMPVDHDLQRHLLRPAHHLVEQIGLEEAAAPGEQFRADVLIELLGVDEQAVEIEGDAADPRRHRGVSVRHVGHGLGVAGRASRRSTA